MSIDHKRFYTMDGMRGAAAILVVVHHIGLRQNLPIVPMGYMAVDFFFALSGFVIALAYEDRLKNGMHLPAFLGIRVIRLYPLFLVGVLLGVLKVVGQELTHDPGALSPQAFMLTFGSSLLMLPSNVPGLTTLFPPGQTIFPLNTPAWSLFFEIIVNLCFAAWLFKLSNRALGLVLLISGIALLSAIWQLGDKILGTSAPTILWGVPRVFFTFFVGVLLFRLTAGRPRRTTNLAHLPNIALIALLLAMPPAAAVHAFEIGMIYIVIPVLIWLAASWEVPAGQRGIYGLLGDISYPIYILHFPLLMIDLAVGDKLHVPLWLLYPASVGSIVIAAYLFQHLYDEPLRRFLAARRKQSIARAV